MCLVVLLWCIFRCHVAGSGVRALIEEVHKEEVKVHVDLGLKIKVFFYLPLIIPIVLIVIH